MMNSARRTTERSNDMKAHPTVILRRPQVEARTGLSRSTIYERMRRGRFPRPIQLGPRSVGWLESDINAWLDERIEETRQAQG